MVHHAGHAMHPLARVPAGVSARGRTTGIVTFRRTCAPFRPSRDSPFLGQVNWGADASPWLPRKEAMQKAHDGIWLDVHNPIMRLYIVPGHRTDFTFFAFHSACR